jgi:hypothetical protein
LHFDTLGQRILETNGQWTMFLFGDSFERFMSANIEVPAVRYLRALIASEPASYYSRPFKMFTLLKIWRYVLARIDLLFARHGSAGLFRNFAVNGLVFFHNAFLALRWPSW